jgi:formylglycine-generating enzyme required for sulfatase activity
MVWIPGGSLLMGSEEFYPEERPVRRVETDGSWIDRCPVTVTEFRRSDVYLRGRHPVTHVAYADAAANAAWAGRSLPTEVEWECAARGGLEGARFAWGDEEFPDGEAMANTWQGEFPWQNLRIDGHEGTSPCGAFPANGYELHDMAGNVWEWTCDPFGPAVAADCCGSGGDPLRGHVIKSGSYLCAPNYCLRYRPAARQRETLVTSTCHIGFRCVLRP